MTLRKTCLHAAVLIALSCAITPLAGHAAPAPAPLTGDAWRLADEGYRAYNRGLYAQAQAKAEAALKLRPDTDRLYLLLVYSLQKQGKIAQALQVADRAIREGHGNPALREARTNLAAAPATGGSAAAPTDTPAYRKGFPIATRAYDEFNAGNHAAAARDAEQAFRTDPSQGAWALLWLDALEAQGQYDAADRAVTTSLALGARNKTDLVARQQTLHRRLAIRPAEAGYQALINDRPGDAVPLAREAVSLAPDITSHRLLLMTALMLDNHLPEAEAAASDALVADDESTMSLVMRAYLRQRQGKTGDANADFDAALKQDWLDNDQRRNVQLIAADAAIASGDGARATSLLSSLPGNDVDAGKRRKQAGAARAPARPLTLSAYPPPLQDCHDTPYGTSCDPLPSDASVSGDPAMRAYAAYGQQDYQTAITLARQAVELNPEREVNQRLLTTALAAGNRAQQAEAAARIEAALAKKPDDSALLMQRGYLRQRLGQPALALEDFRAARATGKAPPTAILDEAFAMSGTGDKRGAVGILKQAIDEADAGRLELDPQQRYNTRAGIAGLSREWGATVSAGFRGSRPAASGAAGAAVTVPGDAVFSTAEVYWRPSDFLNTSTRVFEVYGRVSNTLYDNGGRTVTQSIEDPCSGTSSTVAGTTNNGVSGFPTTVGSAGFRFTPSTETGLTFGLERQFRIGTATRTGTLTPADRSYRCDLNKKNVSANYKTDAGAGGWLAYMTYGFYEGTGLRVDLPSWLTMEGYVQAGYSLQDMPARFWWKNNTTGQESASRTGKLKQDQGFAAGEFRLGRSIRLDMINDRLVLFPYVVIGADWLWQKNRVSGLPNDGDKITLQGDYRSSADLQGNGSTWSLGAGPGFNLRYWFREDHYNAPRSYLDWTTQYRFNIGGGEADRAKGLFMNVTLSY
ncbi:NfrA family protein [Microvirgula aerodenitrificans]|uniref:NfrA family protein n=1 Tax=Microvirgula aerodenitrificans TaxID=57480 RepID=UPI002F3F3B99